LMSRLLQEGGKIIYVAPSGGRDRKNAEGQIEVAPFDPASIEMFYLMAKKAGTPTHFIPLTLATFDLLPPPDTIQKELGEMRTVNRVPIYLSFSKAVDMEKLSGTEEKLKKREKRAIAIWQIVCDEFQKLARFE
jgi:glycerol-3-phosphate O-acyltransferase